MDYRTFLDHKAQLGGNHGFGPLWMPEFQKEHQFRLTEWALHKGRAAVYADCGLGKTLIDLVFAENVARHTGGRVLILAPLAVSHQIAREADAFGIDARVSRDGTLHRITVTNYEKLHLFHSSDFDGVVCDESGILKDIKGTTRRVVTAFMRKIRYRLLATATPAPNDFVELGTSSEALGYLGAIDMMNRFFKHDSNRGSIGGRDNYAKGKWRLLGHAELPFWRWVCSWARAIRKPSDLGCSDEGYDLPELIQREHRVEASRPMPGFLFTLPASGLREQKAEQRATLQERCEKSAELINGTGEPAVAWCYLNPEGDLLERLIPDAVQVRGSDSDDAKERKLIDFASGRTRVLVTKPSIGAWGLNWQHCAHMTFFPSHSYEQFYQSVRRCWRFGQKRPVTVDLITTDGEQEILQNLQRKAEQANQMFARLVEQMNHAQGLARAEEFSGSQEVPSWLCGNR